MQSFILENFGESFKQKKNQGLTTVLHVTFSHKWQALFHSHVPMTYLHFIKMVYK